MSASVELAPINSSVSPSIHGQFRVPVAVTPEGTILNDSFEIVAYAEKHGKGPSLQTEDPAVKAATDKVRKLLMGEALRSDLLPVVMHNTYNNLEESSKPMVSPSSCPGPEALHSSRFRIVCRDTPQRIQVEGLPFRQS